jgi:ABC-2 type transport system permease protein
VPVVAVGLGFFVVLPVIALIVGSGVLGSEIDDGTAVHILAKPLPRRDIIGSKLVVAFGVTVVTVGAAMLLTGLLAGSTGLALGLLAGAAVGGVAYCALFVALSLVTRRPVLIGLVYVVVWEDLLSNLVPGTAVLSVQQYSLATAATVADTDLFNPLVSTPVSLVMAAIITVGATLLAVDRLRSFSVAGETS